MDKRSPGWVAGEWRVYWLSGQALCRLSTGAACRGGAYFVSLVGHGEPRAISRPLANAEHLSFPEHVSSK